MEVDTTYVLLGSYCYCKLCHQHKMTMPEILEVWVSFLYDQWKYLLCHQCHTAQHPPRNFWACQQIHQSTGGHNSRSYLASHLLKLDIYQVKHLGELVTTTANQAQDERWGKAIDCTWDGKPEEESSKNKHGTVCAHVDGTFSAKCMMSICLSPAYQLKPY